MSALVPSFFTEKVSLSRYSTFDIGGKARWLAPVETLEQLQESLCWCRTHRLPFLMIGRGSNSLFHDLGFESLAIVNRLQALSEPSLGCFRIEAGYSFARLGRLTARKGWAGLEFAAGIPGSVGGALYMNAGAGGAETADTLISVEVLYPDGSMEVLQRSQLSFGYRSSCFQKMEATIVAATFQLSTSLRASSRQQELLALRLASQPYSQPSVGCIFRNPPQHSAGALIDQCGLKGYKVGGAAISPKHANFIVNEGGATAADVTALIAFVREQVLQRNGILLESEVRCFSPQGACQ